ncbi:transglycosylase domain-containing protein [Companilactobacillus ginsenosidimutans]|uniref:Glycosyl transferase family 51 n=1 Tax=Companilactobacillus ginsenosidimutans TaxID=1007676 RepID=A0A0H4R1M4_9LACO|nr:transglycosylase domain-containing protein [Companilactobacillus ginsenosidimutans]AKP67635.1 glycosyl transferase family 51 [Companilactobacillus ginsenosidimutans]
MRENRRVGKTVKKKKWPKILLIVVILVVAAFVAIWLKIGTPVKESIADGYSYSNRLTKKDFYPKNSTIIYGADGKELKRFSQSDVDYTDESKVNPLISKGLVEVEDSRFYIHHGIDMYAILRSMGARVFEHRVQGGSTLTQQLVKNVVLKDQSQTFSRKIKEMVIAQEIEKKFSKKQILEFYINDVYMGHATYGFSSAAKYYYSKDQKDLDIGQIAMLIGIPNNPVYYDPVAYPERSVKRRNMVLSIMNKNGLISKKQYMSSRKKPLGLKLNKHTFDNDVSKNYALNYAVFNATEELMKSSGFTMKYTFNDDKSRKDYYEKYAQAYDRARGQLMNGGYSIRTTIDPVLQSKIEELVDKVYASNQSKDKYGKLQPQLASTVIDNKTGNVIAVVGGRGTEYDQINRAVTGYRQPGSAAKPLVAYAPAFERGYLPQSSVTDSPVQGISNWYPGYTGQTTVRHALENSINTVAFKLALQDTKKTYYDDLAKMEFARLTPQDRNPIIALGGFTDGTTTTEMASGYSSFSRQGNFIHPSNIQSVYDESNDRMLYENRHLEKKIYTTDASYLMLNTLQSVVSNGLGKAASLDNFKYTAGKTGTTDAHKDSYFVGMTPDFTIANWTGNDQPSSLTTAQESLAMAAFKSEGEYLVDYLKEKNTDFKKPSTVKVLGDKLTVDDSKKKQTIQDVIDTDFSKFNNAQEEKNKRRLFNMDYRIIYHLSKKEEYSREAKVKKALKKYEDSPITKESQYSSKLDELQKIRYLNINVKRQTAKKQFTDKIVDLQKQLNLKQAQFQADKDNGKLSKYNSEKRKIQDQRNEQRKKMVDKLMPEYNAQVEKVKDAYKNNDSDKEAQKQTLINLMNEIRSYGGSVPDLKLNIDD